MCLHIHSATAARVESPAAQLRYKFDAPSACCGVFDYTDADCTMPYTGHVEEYFRGKLSWESDVADGIGDGFRKAIMILQGS